MIALMLWLELIVGALRILSNGSSVVQGTQKYLWLVQKWLFDIFFLCVITWRLSAFIKQLEFFRVALLFVMISDL